MKSEHKQPLASDHWGSCNYCFGSVKVRSTIYPGDNFYTQTCTKCQGEVKVKIGGASQGEIIQ